MGDRFSQGEEDLLAGEDNREYSDVEELLGNAENIKRYGSPSERAQENRPVRYYFFPTWRSQFFSLIGYFCLAVLSVWGSQVLGWTVIEGRLFTIGATIYKLHLPLFVLAPGFFLGKILIYMYDSKYIIDERGVEAQIGLVSMNLRQPRLRFEDIRGVEPNQTILERIFGIGSVLIGSAMTQDVEIVMEGVANPRAIQLLIGAERDKQMEMLKEGSAPERALKITGD